MRTSVKRLLALVEAYAEDVSFSAPGGGWATVAENDIQKLGEIVRDLIACKYQTDADGDRPIDWQLIDRTKYEPSHFFPIPYTHRAKTAAEYERALDLAVGNVNVATSRLDVLHRCRRELLRREQEKAKEAKL